MEDGFWVNCNKNPINPIFYLVKGGGLYPKPLEDLQSTIGFRGLEVWGFRGLGFGD